MKNLNKNLKIAIVGCVHGDEVVGKRVIEEIKKTGAVNHYLSFFIAHPEAMRKQERFLETDLNRSFPGDLDGTKEERLAYYLREEFSEFDLVIDIHATDSGMDSLAIITSFDEDTKGLLKKVPIERVMLCGKDIFGGKDLISHTNLGISLEYGPDKSGKNYERILGDLKQILINLKVFDGEERLCEKKELYEIFGMYKTPDREGFLPDDRLQDFALIQKGQTVGTFENKELRADFDFYPLFTREGMYKDGFLMSKKRELRL